VTIKKDQILHAITTYVPKHQYELIRRLAKVKQLTMAKLVTNVIENEIDMGGKFDYKIEMPQCEYVEYAYADEAGKILEFMAKLRKGLPLDTLVMCRHDIGVECRETFLLAFRECVEKELIQAYPAPRTRSGVKFAEDYMFYRLKERCPREIKKVRKRSSQYETYLRLQKKFANEEV